MAITINSATPSSGQPSAPARMVVLDLTFDNSYPTGGEDLPAGTIPEGSTIIWAETVPFDDAATLKHVRIDAATQKAQIFANSNGAAGAEVADASDQSGVAAVKVAIYVE